jgi:hypothetical protein
MVWGYIKYALRGDRKDREENKNNVPNSSGRAVEVVAAIGLPAVACILAAIYVAPSYAGFRTATIWKIAVASWGNGAVANPIIAESAALLVWPAIYQILAAVCIICGSAACWTATIRKDVAGEVAWAVCVWVGQAGAIPAAILAPDIRPVNIVGWQAEFFTEGNVIRRAIICWYILSVDRWASTLQEVGDIAKNQGVVASISLCAVYSAITLARGADFLGGNAA